MSSLKITPGANHSARIHLMLNLKLLPHCAPSGWGGGGDWGGFMLPVARTCEESENCPLLLTHMAVHTLRSAQRCFKIAPPTVLQSD